LFDYDAKTKHITFTAQPGASASSSGCVTNTNIQPNPAPGPPTPPVLELGAIIQGDMKLIVGYPGWKDSWDGWITPPTDVGGVQIPGVLEPATVAPHSRATPLDGDNSTLCIAPTPCLFNIATDPTEHNDISAANPDVVAKLTARLMVLLQGEVTIAESGLCPTPLGTKVDARSGELAKKLGFWTPWLPDIPQDVLTEME
jgi:hypothetical protein